MKPRKPWGWYTRYRGHKQDEPVYTPKFLKKFQKKSRQNCGKPERMENSNDTRKNPDVP
jgi:hypothetical protein